jgi:hypothetical protein
MRSLARQGVDSEGPRLIGFDFLNNAHLKPELLPKTLDAKLDAKTIASMSEIYGLVLDKRDQVVGDY